MDAFLEDITYTFSQEGNTNGTTSETEELKITVEATNESIIKQGGFYVIRTKGWSFNDPADLAELLAHVDQGVSAR